MPKYENKERDDALIAEALLGVVNATRAYLPPDGIDEKTCINRILEATDNPEMARIIQRIEERQPKPDRAEVLFDDLYGKTKDEQIDCFRRHFDELRAEWEGERSHGTDWFKGEVDCDGNELVTVSKDALDRYKDQARYTYQRAEKAEACVKELEAERPAVVVPSEVLEQARANRYTPVGSVRIMARFILSLDGAMVRYMLGDDT